MNKRLRFILGLIITAQTALLVGDLTDKWPSKATAEDGNRKPRIFRDIGHHFEGDNSIYNVYCDTERGNLIYSYLASVGNSVSSNLVVLKDGCKRGK